jgi:hypothetical protein
MLASKRFNYAFSQLNVNFFPQIFVLTVPFFSEKGVINIIIKHYKKIDPQDQAIWTSDTSRLTYVISDKSETSIGNEPTWITDKGGVKVNQLIIKPMVAYIDKLMISYTKSLNDIIEKDFDKADEYAEEIQNALDIRTKVRNESTERTLMKNIGPHFYLNKP